MFYSPSADTALSGTTGSGTAGAGGGGSTGGGAGTFGVKKLIYLLLMDYNYYQLALAGALGSLGFL